MPRPMKQTREASIEAATKLFWQNGYHTTSLKDLEGALQMLPGSIYAAFKSKEGLFCEVLEAYAQGNKNILKEYLASSADPLKGLAEFVTDSIQHQEGLKVCLLPKTLLETGDADKDARAMALQMMMGMQDAITRAFEAAQESGHIEKQKKPRHLAQKLQADLVGAQLIGSQVSPGQSTALLTELVDWLESLRTKGQSS